MAGHHDPRCNVCKSPHRAEADVRLLKGDSAAAVSAWAKEAHGQTLSKSSLSTHRTKHLAVLVEARAQLEANRPERVEAVRAIVAGVELLDEIAETGTLLMRKLSGMKKPEEMTMPQVVLLGTCMREVRAAVETKHELLHGKKVDLRANVLGLAGILTLGREKALEEVAAQPGAVRAGGSGPDALEPPGGDPPGS